MAPNDTPINTGFGSSTSNDSGRTGNTGSTGSGSSMGSSGTSGAGASLGTSGALKTNDVAGSGGSMAGGHAKTCDSCGQPVGEGRGLETFLARIGITEQMITSLKSSLQSVDIDEYMNTARTYLKESGSYLKDSSTKAGTYLKESGTKAGTYAKENPGKIAAGVAALAVGAGILINAINRDESSSND